jgi:uncharacterized protein YkwD
MGAVATTRHRRLVLRALLAAAVALVAGAPGGPAGAAAAPAPTGPGAARPVAAVAAPDAHGAAVLSELNRIRARYGVPPLQLDPPMSRGAAAHSRAMARAGVLAHRSWNGRVERAAGNPGKVGEVLGWRSPARAHSEAVWVVRSWLASSIHRVVLLDPAFRRVGVGRAVGWRGGRNAAVYTVDFATAR